MGGRENKQTYTAHSKRTVAEFSQNPSFLCCEYIYKSRARMLRTFNRQMCTHGIARAKECEKYKRAKHTIQIGLYSCYFTYNFIVLRVQISLARFLLEMVEKRNHKLGWIITLSCCNWQIGTKDRLTVVASAHKLYGFEMFLIHNIRIVSILPAFLRNIHCYSHLHSAKLNFLFRAMKKVSFMITRDDVFLSIFRSPTTNRFRSVKTCLHCDNTLISVQQSHVAVLLLF